MTRHEEIFPRQPVDTGRMLPLWRGIRHGVPLLALGLLLVLSWEELRALDPGILRDALHRASTAQLLLLQLAGLVAVAGMLPYDLLLKRPMGVQLPTAQLLGLSWVANTFNNFLGLSGLTGSGIRYFGLTRGGIAGATAVAYSGLLMLSLPVGLSVLAVLALVVGPEPLMRAGLSARTVELALALLSAYLPVYLLVTGSSLLLRRMGSAAILPPAFPVRLLLVAVSGLDWLLAMSVLGLALWAVGAPFTPVALLLGFVAGGVAGILSLVPGGLGVFDATFLLVLAANGVAAEQVSAALLLYRLVYFVVPWVIGVWLSVTVLAVGRESRFGRRVQHLSHSRAAAMVRLPLAVISGLSVRLLSWLTLVAGLVLLISAASPSLRPRVGLLEQWAPLVLVESSHFLSVLVGVLLVALSRGIFSRVRQAYLLTFALLLSGVLFSLLKGLDYEEATLLLMVAILLRAQRKAFFRNSFSLFSRRNAFWLLILAAAVGGYIAVGLLIYSDVPYRSALWFKLGWKADAASRFLRSLLALPLGLLTLLAWMLFRLPRPPVHLPDEAELTRARALFERYGGNPFAHLAFMGDKYLFFSRDGHALIQFGLIGDRAVALGDPCGAPESLEGVIQQFREFADLYDLKPVFYEVSEEKLSLYHDLGFALFKLGRGARVDVAHFSLAGRQGESLRHSVNRARREGARFALLHQPLGEATWQRLAEISRSWLAQKATAEKGFSLGSFRRSYLARSPIAVITMDERIIAFANLMPAYGAHDTLSVDLMRHDPRAPARVMDLLFVELIELASREGYRYFDLGVAPLSGVGESRYARAQERMAHLAFRYGNRFYNYRGLRTFKEKFHPEWRGVYLAYPFNLRAARLLVDIAALIAGGYRAILFKEQTVE